MNPIRGSSVSGDGSRRWLKLRLFGTVQAACRSLGESVLDAGNRTTFGGDRRLRPRTTVPIFWLINSITKHPPNTRAHPRMAIWSSESWTASNMGGWLRADRGKGRGVPLRHTRDTCALMFFSVTVPVSTKNAVGLQPAARKQLGHPRTAVESRCGQPLTFVSGLSIFPVTQGGHPSSLARRHICRLIIRIIRVATAEGRQLPRC